MDCKDAGDFYDERGLFVEDHYAYLFCQVDLFREYGEMVDDDEIPIKDKYPNDELRADFEDSHISNYAFFRYTANKAPETIDEVLGLVSECCFWPPVNIWLNGKFHNTFSQPAISEAGEIVGVRL